MSKTVGRAIQISLTWLFFTTSSASFAWGLAATPKLEPIPLLSIDSSRVTVSGVSSGGFMAVQLHLAHSALIKGAASIAGGIWECAKGDTLRSQGVCMKSPAKIITKEYLDLARDRAARGEIDDLSNLATSRVAIFASPKDTVIKQAAADKLAEFYSNLVPATSIARLSNPTAAHGLPTLGYGNPCSTVGVPWLLNCNDDVAGKVLSAIDPKIRGFATRASADPTSLLYFDQSKHGSVKGSMYGWGAAYIPKGCRDEGAKCGVHVALHECQMNPDFIDKKFIENAGYNEWAESSKLVILYPQSAIGLSNPFGCWDWFGYTGANYTTKSGVQIQVIKNLMAALGAR